ncbi:metal-sensing transcriptional repressor [Helicobacter sp. MIT 14-3879]|uniref:metal-sensing transcriptional repressor n=1 Tax=Helicobacter sp. MIT 14-3879 TaxID=2040649 RepID=UPI000E1F3465|nr:metal-sensing transcriptional repressor [Helicobacter sp. MIT 14-3879]RDU59985.1 metal-sensitive transcriptional repressor [Helicobacter sp. MIT 14-3879]
MEKENAKNIHRRLQKIIGQLNAINTMIDKQESCPNILIQINAAKSAIHKVGQIVLEGHINHCVRDSVKRGDAEKSLEELTKAIEQFSRLS